MFCLVFISLMWGKFDQKYIKKKKNDGHLRKNRKVELLSTRDYEAGDAPVYYFLTSASI